MKRKIDAMHRMFGTGDGQCKDCSHFRTVQANSKKVFKCDIYGMTSSEASDWRMKYPACGLKDMPYEGNAIIDYLRHKPKGKKDL